MQLKLFEVRDRATFIPAFAIDIRFSGNAAEAYLLDRCGLGRPGSYNIIFGRLERGTAYLDPVDWGMNRSMRAAHEWLEEHFDELETGAVLDVEYILGETATPKVSERFE